MTKFSKTDNAIFDALLVECRAIGLADIVAFDVDHFPSESNYCIRTRFSAFACIRKIGEFSYGFASQRFSGGGSTQKLWAGYEFGSNRLRQFPRRTPSKGRGNAGYFIYPTLRKIQPELINKWEQSFDRIIKEWL